MARGDRDRDGGTPFTFTPAPHHIRVARGDLDRDGEEVRRRLFRKYAATPEKMRGASGVAFG